MSSTIITKSIYVTGKYASRVLIGLQWRHCCRDDGGKCLCSLSAVQRPVELWVTLLPPASLYNCCINRSDSMNSALQLYRNHDATLGTSSGWRGEVEECYTRLVDSSLNDCNVSIPRGLGEVTIWGTADCHPRMYARGRNSTLWRTVLGTSEKLKIFITCHIFARDYRARGDFRSMNPISVQSTKF